MSIAHDLVDYETEYEDLTQADHIDRIEAILFEELSLDDGEYTIKDDLDTITLSFKHYGTMYDANHILDGRGYNSDYYPSDTSVIIAI